MKEYDSKKKNEVKKMKKGKKLKKQRERINIRK
jgi:hypothetical protein